MINKARLIKLTQELISINSQNPPGNEAVIAGYIKDYLGRLGVKTRIYEFKKKRSSIVAVLKGESSRHSLLITPHLDTVPAGKGWKSLPLSAKIAKGKIFGLGATDCKGNLACSLEAIQSMVEDKTVLGYDLIFAATADEECGSGLGLIPLLNKGILSPTAALVLDSDDFKIIVAQKGLMHIRVKLSGIRAHGAYPWRGRNAINAAVNILKELNSVHFEFRKSRYLRAPTVNIGTIKGGDKVNVVADWCEFELDFRFLPGSSPVKIREKLMRIIRRHAKKFKVEAEAVQAPYFISPRHPLVAYLKSAMSKFGIPARIAGSEGATVITFFQNKNIPACATGFGVEGCAHTKDEYVTIGNLYKGAQVLEEFLKSYRFKE